MNAILRAAIEQRINKAQLQRLLKQERQIRGELTELLDSVES
jgi:hypothetical protein